MTTFTSKIIHAAGALVLGSAIALPAVAQTTDMRAYTCRAFLAADQEEQIAVSYWIDGYLSHQTANLVIDTETLVNNIFAIEDACSGQPESRLLDLLGL